MKTVIINQIRHYYKDCTISNVFCNEIQDTQFCYTLEDIARPVNVKVDGATCIPEGTYEVAITHSPRYRKDMIQLSNNSKKSVTRDGKTFTGIRVHGGNDVEDTLGCPLAAYNFDGDTRVWGKASDHLQGYIQRYLDDGYKVLWVISSY